ncbi:hypothetical protein JQ594_15315 [Bradyrhizobium manausense]|uniref:hypothetical protein n=1 Tax=Bradyrhizobium manausense TaxID=989370 RepID=UPI001BAD433E|nr:hypothetical protein [Bradyrhizobium manausense]MBR0687299.1 hypothetical protein [Bradyrhizobium manausense]
MTQLRPCVHCKADFLPTARQRFCSRSCAARGRPRPARAAAPRPKRHNDRRFLRLLALGHCERRGGIWRWGTRRIRDSVVARLIASGRAEIDGSELRLKRETSA